ncbi:inositol monophosphatase [Prolixibacteraceae bacterium Z1-6]|uniref:Inositol monophosphatase n=1 Tax=Draconibacterium aestuarii TaxID=2998507 RepID=A0A9X3F600_9BACT|nr:inositol monophosphatase [Prolixibacteraceae bacterium Z1-6]
MKEILHTALYEAGKILLDNFGKISDYEVKESQSSIVTKSDIDSEKRIMEIIEGEFPLHNLLGEETGFRNKKSEYTWVVDPIDGTSNFAAGIPWFGVIICVLKDFKPYMAGCYLPVPDQLYFAEKGEGATLNGNAISVSKEVELKNILMSYSLDFSDEPGKTEKEAKTIQMLVQNVRNLRSTNCLIDFCYTADGKLGGCANRTTKIWDIAGPVLLIEEAGGIATDLKGNALDFYVTDEDYGRNFEILASNKILHSKVISVITN